MKRSQIFVSILLACVAISAALQQQGETVFAQEHVGVYSQAEVVLGSQLYTANCVVCHGLEGASIAGVDLRRGLFKTAVTDDDLKRVITRGVSTAGMPPFAMPEADQNAIVSFIRTGFSTETPKTAGPPGDAGKGRALVEGPKGECLSCHRINGQGGRSGPDLSDVGTTRTAAALAMSLTEPTNAMLPINRPVTAVTADGRTVVGRRANEDTYMVLLSTAEGRLVALEKKTLRSFTISKMSPMPSYKSRLSDQEQADVVAYLITLKDATTSAANPFLTNPLTSATRPSLGGRR